MPPPDDALRRLVDSGKKKGFLSWADARGYLDDAASPPDKLDRLLKALEDAGVELLDEDGEAS